MRAMRELSNTIEVYPWLPANYWKQYKMNNAYIDYGVSIKIYRELQETKASINTYITWPLFTLFQ